MEKFRADAFFAIGRYLAEVRTRFTHKGSPDTVVAAKSFAKGTEGHEIFTAIGKHCEAIGLRISTKCVEHIIKTHEKDSTIGQTLQGISELEQTISWEMEDKLFMFIPPERASFYDQPELLGKDVNSKFPTIQFDIVEAGNCYAAGRSTAVVFHLMRIVEIAVQEFGKKLGVSFVGEKNWQNILDETNKAIKALNPKDPKTVEISQASANLYAVKLAWRNEVMHPKDTYTLEEANNLISQVKIFMMQLAQIV